MDGDALREAGAVPVIGTVIKTRHSLGQKTTNDFVNQILARDEVKPSLANFFAKEVDFADSTRATVTRSALSVPGHRRSEGIFDKQNAFE